MAAIAPSDTLGMTIGPAPRRLATWSGALVFAGVLHSCNRYELRPVHCPPALPSAASTIAWERVPGGPGALSVEIQSLRGTVSLQALAPQLRLDSLPWRVFESDGRTHFDSLSPGPHELRVRALGFRAARATVIVPTEGGTRALVVMAVDPIVFDESCSMMYRARKPWWKLW